MKNKVISLFLSISIIFGVFMSSSVDTEASGTYCLNDYSVFSSKTKEAIASRYYSALSLASQDYYSSEPSFVAPYSGGRLSDATHKSMTELLNYYRWLTGVAELPVSSHSDALQAAAVVRNFQFGHTVDRSSMPSDMPDDFFNLGSTANHNIIAMGFTPQGAITGFLQEGYNLSNGSFTTMGHRAMLLSYMTTSSDFGYAGKICIGLEGKNSKADSDIPFFGFPVPGYAPTQLITSPKETSWSFEINSKMLTYSSIDSVNVNVKDLTTGASYDCNTSNGKLKYEYNMFSYVQPSIDTKFYEHKYQITITGISDNGGTPVTLTYTTEFFDVSSYVDTNIERITFEGVESLGISDNMNTADLNSLNSILPNEVTAVCENGRNIVLPLSSQWKYDASQGAFVNSVSIDNLPEHVKDANGVTGTISIPVNIDYYGKISASPAQPSLGGNVDIKLTRYYVNTTKIFLYKIDSLGNCTLVADGSSSCFEDDADGIHAYFHLTNFQEKDNGKYFISYGYDFMDELYIVGTVDLFVEGSNPTSNPTPSGNSSPTPTPTSSVTPGAIPTPIPTASAELDVGDFVERCYTVALNRSSDSDGYSYWRSELTEGRVCGAQAAYGFIFSQEYTGRNTSNSQFVEDLYSMFFGREPDADGFDFWVAQLNEGASRESVFAGFANSVEFNNLCNKFGVVSGYYAVGIPNEIQGGVNCFVSRLYAICLDRLPDPAGQAGWVTQLIKGTKTGSEVAYGFVFSPEFIGRNMSYEQYVAYLYRAFFGREPDVEGFNMWVQELINGQDSFYVFRGFVNSQEFDNLCSKYNIIRGTI
ncbi:MAG: DUF4214 domain-containing protein [Clostridia bacterium]|nr:DUF4214 domain-containing protein [Clostridia bacterium]